MRKDTLILLTEYELREDPEKCAEFIIEEMIANREPEIKFVDNGVGHYEVHGYRGFDSRIEPEIDDYPLIVLVRTSKDTVEECSQLFLKHLVYEKDFLTDQGYVQCEIEIEETIYTEKFNLRTLQYELYWNVC